MARRREEKPIASASRGEEMHRFTWLNEAVAVFLFALASYLFVSFMSIVLYRSTLPKVDPVASVERMQTLVGPVGRFLGVLLAGCLGWCGIVPILALVALGFHAWRMNNPSIKLSMEGLGIALVGAIGAVFSLAALCVLLFGREGGGSIGAFFALPVQHLLRGFGAGLFFASLLVVSVALATHARVSLVILASVRGIFFTLGAALALARLALVLVAKLFLWPTEYVRARREEPDDEPLPVLPPPRVRRSRAPKSAEGAAITQDMLPVPASEEEKLPVAATAAPAIVIERRKPKEPEPPAKKHPADEPIDLEQEPEVPYVKPELDLLAAPERSTTVQSDEELQEIGRQIEVKLKDFSVDGKIVKVHPGPVITLFEFEPAPGVKVGKVAALQDDLAMSLRATSIRILAPIPGRGTVGIEVPNRHREIVRLRELLESSAMEESDSILAVPLGKDTYGDPIVADIAQMPHLLMAGATGTGKSVCINALLLSLLYRASPSELGLILIDPKVLELSVYEGIPHLRVPVVTVPKQAKAVLDWAVKEMDRRYRMMQRYGVRNIDSYNAFVRGEDDADVGMKKPVIKDDTIIELKEKQMVEEGAELPPPDAAGPSESPAERGIIGEQLEELPKIVIVIDELADLMLTVGREVEELITRLAQKARASGIHLILATQRPSVDVITGLIKANFPARVSFRVASRIDSRTILDSMGAEKLLGRGDMLFMLPGAAAVKRLHGAFVADNEVKRVVQSIREKSPPRYDERIMAVCEKALEEEAEGGNEDIFGGEYDAFYDKAVELVLEKRQASTSMIQRVFRIGYNRAARIIETMEKEGIVGPADGAKGREVLSPLRDSAE